MESSTSPESLPCNYINEAIQELTRGRELINTLREVLWWSETLEFDCTTEDDVVVQIQSMFENALSIMSSCNSSDSGQFTASDLNSSCHLDGHKAKHSDQSLSSRIPVKIRRGCYKRRKNSWTSTQVSSALVDDGYAWRKYGQKDILNEKYHRSYYRCTCKFDQGCLATKQVQMIQEKPTKYKTTYIGHHTCKNLLRAPQIVFDSSHIKNSSIFLSFGTNDLVEKKRVDHNFGAVEHEFKEGFPSTNNFRHCSSS